MSLGVRIEAYELNNFAEKTGFGDLKLRKNSLDTQFDIFRKIKSLER